MEISASISDGFFLNSIRATGIALAFTIALISLFSRDITGIFATVSRAVCEGNSRSTH